MSPCVSCTKLLQRQHLYLCAFIQKVCGRTEGRLFVVVPPGDAGRMREEHPGRVIASLATPTALQIKNSPPPPSMSS